MSRHDQREFGQVLGIGTGYSVTDVARYLQYSPESIIYWLRTGNLQGERDPRSGEWRVMPQNLVAFLRNTSEQMPAGVSDVTLVTRDVAGASSAPGTVEVEVEVEAHTAVTRRERMLVPAR